MVQRNFKHLSPDVLLSVESVEAGQATAVATAPGGCEGGGYPLFVDLSQRPEVELETGAHACLEFILPGRPGRWRAAGQVALALPSGGPGLPRGLCLELLGLTLTQDAPAAKVALAAEAEAEEIVGFDPREMEIEDADVCGMLSDLLGRDVGSKSAGDLGSEIPDDAIVAYYRNDEGEARFAIVLDKPAAARVGGALTMMPPEGIDQDAKGRAPLDGEPLENATEVLNIMSALFHEAGAPHIVLAETMTHAEVRAGGDEALCALLDGATWSLAVGMDIEEYGEGATLLLAI